MCAEEYLGYLRALYKRKPDLFHHWARTSLHHNITLVGYLPHVRILYSILVHLARQQGLQISGGERHLLAYPT